MAFDPDYGETLLTEEERAALTSEARELLGEPIQSPVADDLLVLVLDVVLSVTDL